MVSDRGLRDRCFSCDTSTFLSLTLTSISLRIPTAAETIIYVAVMNRGISMLEAERKIEIEMWPSVLRKAEC